MGVDADHVEVRIGQRASECRHEVAVDPGVADQGVVDVVAGGGQVAGVELGAVGEELVAGLEAR